MKALTVFLMAFCVFVSAQLHAADDLTSKEARATVADFANKLESDYLDPEIAAAYAQTLRTNLAKGDYDGFSETGAFAEKVTADLHAIYPDGHLRLRIYEPQATAPSSAPRDRQAAYEAPVWIKPGIVYAKWRAFTGEDDSLAAADDLLANFGGAKALIIDLREHRGGGLDEQDLLFSKFFPQPTHLVTMRIRDGKGEFMAEAFDSMASMKRKPTEKGVNIWEHWSMPASEGESWAQIPVYLLTSNTTASAAEHFTLSLKRTGRATVIGETTRGAGNFGSGQQIGERFYAFIGVGQTVDPETGKGWDVSGIAPDVEVSAEDALNKALNMIHARM